MQSKKQIFYLQSCNEWKENSSMSLVCITTSPTKIKKAIATEILNGNMEYSTGEDATPKQQAEQFKRDWKILTRAEINNRLTYGFYDYAYDGEIL